MDERLNTLVAEVLQIAPSSVRDELAMHDVPEWDSLSHMELITSLEAEFSIELAWDDIVAMHSVGSIREVLRKKTG